MSKKKPKARSPGKLETAIRQSLSKVSVKKLVAMNIPYLIAFYVVEKCAWLYRHCIGGTVVQKLGVMLMNLPVAFRSWIPSFHIRDLLAGIIGALLLRCVVYMKGKNAKKFRQGEEYGSARWGNEKDIEPFIDPVFENNIILTQTERLTMNSRPKLPKYARNKNVIVIGGSGSGKTRFYVKPNLMQMPDNVSYVVTDPKGTIIVECGTMLVRHGYRIKVLNTINFKKSMHYNPFHYIRCEKDILKLVNTIIANTKGEGEKATEDFWVKAERLLYTALIGYIWYEAPEEEQNFATLLEFINASETREEDEEFKNAVDELFEELEAENPEHFAVRQYRKYKLAAGKTAKSILISCGARLAPFDIAELRELTRYDEMELDMLGDQKTAMFVIISDTDDTFNFIVAIMYTQLFNLLCDKADDEHGGRLPYHVRLLLDEFSNIGQIPKFDKLIATIRSREISASIILQSQSQLKTIYKDAAETIIGNCDTVLFLGGKESSTLKEISETLGKETIDLYNTSDTRGNNRSYGLNYQKTGKDLMSRDELAVMDGNKCILQLRGVRPFFSDKYDITKHRRYKELSDYNRKNEFDIEKYLEHKLVISRDTAFEMHEYEITKEDIAAIEAEEGERYVD
ncbi:TraM recognition domain-containing protein [Lachnospiraceae bacterium BSM-380-WT-5A]|uniref:TraM recognition domain-containing protein n=2 Tax=Lachnospiraceae TaxID=186803 RepID=A0A6N7YIH0_9FIRM|nr:TraM recognition domain-containing protein [Oliverpabstia intestinalis]MSU82200.1 TraM recognition domain-containing protein [Anaerobutyricum soehngenii]